MHHPDENIMRELIHDQWTKHSIYAAVVDGNGQIIAKGRTTVGQANDPTAHAEVNAIREACRQLGVSQFPAGCISPSNPARCVHPLPCGLALTGLCMPIILTIAARRKTGHSSPVKKYSGLAAISIKPSW